MSVKLPFEYPKIASHGGINIHQISETDFYVESENSGRSCHLTYKDNYFTWSDPFLAGFWNTWIMRTIANPFTGYTHNLI